jgi:hypothetical protein
VDDLHARIGQQVVEVSVGGGHTEIVGSCRATLRGTAEHTADLDPDATQRLDVDRADEAGPDDGGADGREIRQWRLASSCLAPSRDGLDSLDGLRDPMRRLVLRAPHDPRC